MSHAPSVPTESGEYQLRYFFVRRPVMAAVISITVTLLGFFALQLLPINRYPQITPPSVSVVAVYPGATAEDVALSVAAPIEQQLSGIDGLMYYKSANSSDGSMRLTATFDISRSQDLAAVDVQNAIKLAEPQLPEEVRRNGVIVTKAQSDILFIVSLYSDDRSLYDEAFLTNYAKIRVEDEVKRVPGVGQAMSFGALDFAMNISVDPDRMAQLGITIGDIATAVREQSTTNPGGRLGREPAPEGTQFTIPVTTTGRLQTAEEFGDVIVRANTDGSFVRVKDVADIALASRNYDQAARLDGKPTTLMLVYLRSGANALEVRELVGERMDELAASFPPGVHWTTPFDTTPFISESIAEVIKTLAEAMLLVTLVVFLFLQSWRATLIPVLAVPVSVIGTFLGLLVLGFTINVLTLFGLVLAIGIVVDDAIVVIENVERIMTEEGVSARIAADRAMGQVAGALIAIVLVLCAVFIPVAFLGGVTGGMYKQFAVTIVLAVLLSGMVALTLTPALCAVLLKEGAPTEAKSGFFGWFNRSFSRVTGGYIGAVGRILGRPRTAIAAFVVFLGLTLLLFRHTPQSFIPPEDKGFFAIGVQLPDGASKQRTEAVVERIEDFLLADSAIDHTVALVGLDALSFAAQTNSAVIFVGLKPWEERNDPNLTIDAVVGRVNGQLFQIQEALAFAFNFPEIPGLGTTAGLEMYLQARGDLRFDDFAASVQEFVADANQLPVLTGVQTTFRANVPQLRVTVDREAAKSRGVLLTDIFQTMQASLSTLYINDFNLFGRTYRVQAQAQAPFRQVPEDIGRLHVRSSSGEMIPLAALTTTSFEGGPSILTRFNGRTAAMITGTPAPGHSSGEMLEGVEQLMKTKYASRGVDFAFGGESYQETTSSGDSSLVFVLGLILVFLVLAAQYESWGIPFAVILGIPFGIFGAFLGVWLRGMPSDIYFQVGLITVVGLAAKNAILIVEFATALHVEGMSIIAAATEAARERFRPILMTSFAFIFGVLPLAIAQGAGAASRRSLGTSVFFGMLLATSIGVFFIPTFFTLIRQIIERRTRVVSAPEAE